MSEAQKALDARYAIGERVTVVLKNGSIRAGTITRIIGGTNYRIKVDGAREYSFSPLGMFKEDDNQSFAESACPQCFGVESCDCEEELPAGGFPIK